MKNNITITTNDTLEHINRLCPFRNKEVKIYKIIPVEVEGIELHWLRYVYRIIYTVEEELVSAFFGSQVSFDTKHLANGGFEFIHEGIRQLEGYSPKGLYKMDENDSLSLFVRWEMMPFEK